MMGWTVRCWSSCATAPADPFSSLPDLFAGIDDLESAAFGNSTKVRSLYVAS